MRIETYMIQKIIEVWLQNRFCNLYDGLYYAHKYARVSVCAYLAVTVRLQQTNFLRLLPFCVRMTAYTTANKRRGLLKYPQLYTHTHTYIHMHLYLCLPSRSNGEMCLINHLKLWINKMGNNCELMIIVWRLHCFLTCTAAIWKVLIKL